MNARVATAWLLAAGLVGGPAAPGRTVRADDDAASAPAAPVPAPAATTAPPAEDDATLDREAAAAEERDLRVAQAVRAGVVRIQWRAPGPEPEVHERNALVVDPQGFLLLAGPIPPPHGTLTAAFSDGNATKASVVASDRETALTLLWVPLTGLPAPKFRAPPPADEAPVVRGPALPDGLRIGTRVVMVTGDGAVARGWLRGSDRHRDVAMGRGEEPVRLTCLDEAAMPTVPEDVGSPWLDAEGRVLGLVVGAAGSPEPWGRPADPARIEPVAAYAIPARVIAVVWPLLRTNRFVARSTLGVAAEAVDEAVEQHVCQGCGGGKLILGVDPDGPADVATVRRHDILLAIAGVPLRHGTTIADALLPHRPGSRVALDLVRKGARLRVEITLGARTAD